MENKFYNELSKFKKAEKVELGAIDDFNKRIDAANDERNGAAVAYTKVIGKLNKAAKHLEIAIKDGKKVEQAADEIGVKVNIDVKAVEAKYKQFIKIVNTLNNVKIRG